MRSELTSAACIMVFCAVLYHQAASLPLPRFEILGPAFFPKLVLSIIMGLNFLHMIMVVARHYREKPAAVSSALAAKGGDEQSFFLRILPAVAVAYFVLYALMISYTEIPYLALTFVYVALTSWTLAFFRPGALLPAVLVSLGVTGFIYVVFARFLELLLP